MWWTGFGWADLRPPRFRTPRFRRTDFRGTDFGSTDLRGTVFQWQDARRPLWRLAVWLFGLVLPPCG
ncbi:pentapeptide repeat-containing protein [Pseudarthrobacter sp. L1SW]|uniref:pentapeptide repeat-containing protein n=1 Tax=Pseudarthrobacter sp. L1SW TaxID=2851598 RepID=UPI00351DA242